MGKNVEKDKALAQVLADIEKQFGKGAIMKLGDQEKVEIEVPKKMEIKENDEQENIEKPKEENQKFAIPNFIKGKQKISSARKGTVMHLCMQKLDNKKEYNIEEIEKLVQNLVKQNLITEEEGKVVNLNNILKFTKSVIGNELKKAKRIYKEKPFYINIKSKDIFKEYENIEEDILVQGIIDLYYITENEELVLVDYKTDFVKQGEESLLVAKYLKQIQIYKEALENALNRKVDRTYIYSVYLNKEILV